MSSPSSSLSPEPDSSDNDEGRTSTSGDLSLVAGTAAAAMVAEAISSAIASVEGDTAGAEAGATGPPLGEQVQQQVQQLDEQVCASTTLLHVCALSWCICMSAVVHMPERHASLGQPCGRDCRCPLFLCAHVCV